MLPITSPFDTYRAGLWALRRNIGVAAAYVGLMTAISIGFLAVDAGSPEFSVGTGAAIVLSLVLLAAVAMIPAILVYPLHATFLSDGRVSGLAAIDGLGRLLRIGWRLLVIFVLALIPAVAVILSVFYALPPELTEAAAGPEQEAALADGVVLAVYATMGLFFGLSIILFGPLIPDIVAKTDATPGPSSFQVGTRCFRRMAPGLAVGPGLVLAAHEAFWWPILGGPGAESDGGFAPLGLLSEFTEICVTTFCSAMVAGILSDAYRRAGVPAPAG